jgi:ribosome-binding factor A
MSSRRIAKVAEAVREIVSTVVLFELKDPRVKNVTVLRADVSPDLRNAKVYVSIMGDEKTQSLTLHGLNSARGFIQSKIADRLQTRYTPVLQFVSDPGVKLSVQASAIIRETLSEGAVEDAESDATAVVGSETGENEHTEEDEA